MRRVVVGTAVAVSVFVLALGAGRAVGSNSSAPPAPMAVVTPSRQDDPVQAALATVRLLGSAEMYDRSARTAALRQLLSAELRKSAEQGFDRAASTLGLLPDGSSEAGTLVARLVPVGHHVVEQDRTRAVVAVWTVGLLGIAGPTSPQPVQTTWSTETLVLERVGARWICTSLQHEDGPAPVSSAQVPAAPSELLEHDGLFAEPA